MIHEHNIWQYNPLWEVWTLQHRISDECCSRVFLAKRECGDRRMLSAVKWIPVEINANLEKYVEEAYKLYDLRSCKHIVCYEDHVVYKRGDGTGHDVFLRMEYLKPLKKWISEKGINLFQLINLALSIIEALEACNEIGILHRDIKIDNIFVSDTGVFKLGDFGISSRISDSVGAGIRGGSPLYIAPEVLSGSGGNSLSDQYALGKLLFYISVNTERPKSGHFDAAMDWNSWMPEELKKIIEKTTSIRPKDRFHSLDKLKEALRNCESELDIRLGNHWIYKVDESNQQSNLTVLKTRGRNPFNSMHREVSSRSRSGSIYVLWSPYPSGKTTLAANLAYGMSKRVTKGHIALLDLDFTKKTLFYHFPICFENLSAKYLMENFSRYRSMMEEIHLNRFKGKMNRQAYTFGKLDVFTSHRDIKMTISTEACIKLLHLAFNQYDDIVIDLPSECPTEILNLLAGIRDIKRYMVITPDLEVLSTAYDENEAFRTWKNGTFNLIINKDIGLNIGQYIASLSLDQESKFYVTKIPDVYAGAVRAKYHGTMLYDLNSKFKQALDGLMEGYNCLK